MKSQSHEITVIVSGGVVQDIRDIPVGVVVRVMDYDVEGSDLKGLPQDDDGAAYVESRWPPDSH